VLSLISKTNPLDKYSYFLSNKDAFFYRFCDTGFKNKWAGFWSAGTKFVEFFDFKVNEEFLCEKNCISVYYDFLKAIHSHELGDGRRVNQKIWMPREKPFLIVELLSKKPIDASFEIAVNIRSISENQHGRKYSVKKGKRLAVENSLGRVVISTLNGKHSFKPCPEYRAHSPGGEQQNFFIPGKLSLSGKRIVLQIAAGKNFNLKSNELLHKFKRYRKTAARFVPEDKRICLALENAAMAVESLRYGNSFIAGLPWFQQYWSRDLLWSLPALTELGMFEDCRNSLYFLAKNSLNGRLPNYVFGAEKTYNSIDANPLFLIALEHYIRHSNDKAFLKKIGKAAIRSLLFLESRRDKADGFISHDIDSSETWMDTLRRREKAVEVQALYIAALRAFSSLVPRLPRPSKALKEKAASAEMESVELSEKFDKAFYRNGFFADALKQGKRDSARRINALVPLFLGASARKEVLEPFRSKEFQTAKGITSLSKKDKSFSPSAYHNGKIWSLGNAWLCGAEFALGSEENAWRYFDWFARDSEEGALGCIGECWDAATLKQAGCPNQLWGNAMAVRLFTEFALGLELDAGNKTISLSPKLGAIPGVGARLRVGGKEGALKLDLKKRTAHFSIPSYKVELK